MGIKRPYPETYRPVKGRAPRVATLPDGRMIVLKEPGFAMRDCVVACLCEAAPAQEGLGQAGLALVAPAGDMAACSDGAPLVAGIWCDPQGRVWLAWSDGAALHACRTRQPVTTLDALADPEAWETYGPSLPNAGRGGSWHLGSGVLCPGGGRSLLVVAAELPAGRIALGEVGPDGSVAVDLHTHPLNHTPNMAVDPDGRAVHVVWDTEDLRICYRSLTLDDLRGARAVADEPRQIWIGCHDPDVVSNGREVVVAYTGHMQHIKYGWYDGRDWHLDRHLTTLHPRFAETLEHSPWFWTDGDGVVHLSFVCLTRTFVYDSRWLGEGFSDPQPVEGLAHPSVFGDEVRVKAERMSLDRDGGAMLLSSTFLPEQHGLYTRPRQPVTLRSDESLLFLDLDEVAQLTNLQAALVPLHKDPVEPIFEPTDRDEGIDGLRVLNGGTVVKDGGTYRMWYGACPLHPDLSVNWYHELVVGYAESENGVVWRRVDTGVNAEFRGRPAPNRVVGMDYNASVFIDPTDTPQRRYKAIWFETRSQRLDRVEATGRVGYLGLPRRGRLATSPDGFAWEQEEAVVEFPGPEPYGMTPQQAFHDPHEADANRRFKAIGFTSLVGRRRGATVAYSPDCLRWTVAERSPLLDSMAAVTPVRPAGPFAQIHDASMCRYGRYLLAFYGYQFDGRTEDIRLATSRDGDRFHFVFPETPLVAHGGPGAWDTGYMMPSSLIDDGRMLQFFYGCHTLTSTPDGTGLPPWRVCAGRAVCLRDRFVRLSPKEAGRPAVLVTVAPRTDGPSPLRLQVNAKLAGGSQLRVALVDPQDADRELTGYEAAACSPITGDSTRHGVRWRNQTDVPGNGAAFRVKLVLQGTSEDALYSLACGERDSE